MARSRWIAFGLVVGFAFATAAEAALQPIDQNRRVVAFTTVSVGEDVAHDSAQSGAPDFDLFDDGVSVTESLPGTSASAEANQRSDLDDNSFFFVGDFAADATADVPEAFSEGFGQSIFSLTFTVDELSILSVYGDLVAGGSGQSHFTLVGPDLVYTASQTTPGTLSLLEEFVLEPGGSYSLAIHTNGFGQAFDGVDTVADGSVFVNGFLSSVVDVPVADGLADLRAYPNPTRGSVTFELGDERGALTIFDASGRLVNALDATSSVVSWDGRGRNGAFAAPGVYFYRLAGGEAKRLVVIE